MNSPLRFRFLAALILAAAMVAPTLAQPISLGASYLTDKIGTRETDSQSTASDETCADGVLALSGTDQNWDLSSCTAATTETVVSDYGNDVPGEVPLGDDAAFTGGNFYQRGYTTNPIGEESFWIVSNVTSSSWSQLGASIVFDADAAASAKTLVNFDTLLSVNDPPDATPLPVEYLGAWDDTTAIYFAGSPSSATFSSNTVDGWGTLKTPDGEAAALRISSVDRDWLWTFDPFLPGFAWVFQGTSYSYSFITLEGLSATVGHDNAGTALDVTYSSTSAELPVELTSFDAVVDGESIVVRWSTESEKDNAGFAIEHAFGDESFREVSFVQGAGTSVSRLDYQFVHGPEIAGIHRYRLRQVDFGGGFTYSPVIEVEYEAPVEFLLAAPYPNPFNPTAQVRFQAARSGRLVVGLYDMLGREVVLVFDADVDAGRAASVSIDGRGLASGTYWLRATDGVETRVRSVTLLK